MARKNITKKMRFDVFKRDTFTCQYCGRVAPDVVLEIDHIKPVAKGGTNDIKFMVLGSKNWSEFMEHIETAIKEVVDDGNI